MYLYKRRLLYFTPSPRLRLKNQCKLLYRKFNILASIYPPPLNFVPSNQNMIEVLSKLNIQICRLTRNLEKKSFNIEIIRVEYTLFNASTCFHLALPSPQSLPPLLGLKKKLPDIQPVNNSLIHSASRHPLPPRLAKYQIQGNKSRFLLQWGFLCITGQRNINL